MDKKTWVSSVAEARAITELIKHKFDVFDQFTAKAPFDLVAHKDGKLYRVEVKSTSTRTPKSTGWVVQIKKVRSNKTANKIYPFDSSSCDIVAVYIAPIERMVFLKSSDVKTRASLTIMDKDLKKPDWRL